MLSVANVATQVIGDREGRYPVFPANQSKCYFLARGHIVDRTVGAPIEVVQQLFRRVWLDITSNPRQRSLHSAYKETRIFATLEWVRG